MLRGKRCAERQKEINGQSLGNKAQCVGKRMTLSSEVTLSQEGKNR